jgi:NitT/TauT family transport system ATP-binding protein
MDEPFTALDELTRESITEEVLQLWQRFQPTVTWVTHSISEAVRMADRVLVMSPRPGKILAQHQIKLSRPRDDTAQSFQSLVRAIREDLAMVA